MVDLITMTSRWFSSSFVYLFILIFFIFYFDISPFIFVAFSLMLQYWWRISLKRNNNRSVTPSQDNVPLIVSNLLLWYVSIFFYLFIWSIFFHPQNSLWSSFLTDCCSFTQIELPHKHVFRHRWVFAVQKVCLLIEIYSKSINPLLTLHWSHVYELRPSKPVQYVVLSNTAAISRKTFIGWKLHSFTIYIYVSNADVKRKMTEVSEVVECSTFL